MLLQLIMYCSTSSSIGCKGFGKNDKFIAPTLTFAATVECGEYLGMEPILVDCEMMDSLLILTILKIF